MKSILSIITMGLLVSAAAQASDLVCLYTGTNYQGARFCFYPGQMPPNLDAFPLNDGTYSDGYFGSIQVLGSAQVTIYDSIDYQSASQPILLNSSVPDLSTVWNTTIESIDVE